MLVCVFFAQVCTRDRGCSAHPAFPAPSDWRGREINEYLAQKTCGEVAKVRRLSTSSRRTPGPITTGRRDGAKASNSVSQHKRHGVWVPAFAGTTLRLPNQKRRT